MKKQLGLDDPVYVRFGAYIAKLATGDFGTSFRTREPVITMISRSRVPADLVVLVACCSGQRAVGGMGIQFWPGDDLFGLQAAFRAAGVRQVIGSLWNAKVRAAKSMAGLVYDAWVNGADAATSIQRAARELYKDPLHQQKYEWAPFTAVQFGMPVVA